MLNKGEELTDEINDRMPFYGKVRVEVNGTFMQYKQFRLNIPRREQYIQGCINCPECGGIGPSIDVSESNLHINTPVKIEIDRCDPELGWIPVSIQKVLINNEHYRLEWFNGGEWLAIGYLTYTEQNPCVTLPNCSSPENNFEYNRLVNQAYVPPSRLPQFEPYTWPCDQDSIDQLGGFNKVKWHLPIGYSFAASGCKNSQTGRVQIEMKFKDAAGNISKNIPVVYVVALCLLNDPFKVRINDKAGLITELVTMDHSFDSFSRLLLDICGHLNPKGVAAQKYILSEPILLHEDGHATLYKDVLEKNLIDLKTKLNDMSTLCLYYSSIDLAMEENTFNSVLEYFFSEASDKFYESTNEEQDIKIQGSNEMKILIREYYEIAWNWIDTNQALYGIKMKDLPKCKRI